MPRPCGSCKKREPKPGRASCQKCIDKAVRSRKAQDQRRKERMRLYAATRVDTARAAGLCLLCKAAPIEQGKSCCARCSAKRRAQNNQPSERLEEQQAFRDLVRRHASGWFPRSFATIYDLVLADWGAVNDRRVSRALLALVESGTLDHSADGYRIAPHLRMAA